MKPETENVALYIREAERLYKTELVQVYLEGNKEQILDNANIIEIAKMIQIESEKVQ